MHRASNDSISNRLTFKGHSDPLSTFLEVIHPVFRVVLKRTPQLLSHSTNSTITKLQIFPLNLFLCLIFLKSKQDRTTSDSFTAIVVRQDGNDLYNYFALTLKARTNISEHRALLRK